MNPPTKKDICDEFSAEDYLLSGWGVFLVVMGVVSVILDVVAICYHSGTGINPVIFAVGSFTLGWLVIVLIYWNPNTGRREPVPRHAEVPDLLVRKICRALQIPEP